MLDQDIPDRRRDLAVEIATTRDVRLVPGGPLVYSEAVLSISYVAPARPCVLSVFKWGFDAGIEVLNVVRRGGDAVVTTYLTGSWADRLRRLAAWHRAGR